MSRCVLVRVVLFVVFKFSGVKSLLVGDGDESVIFTADGVVDSVFSDVDRVDGVDGGSAVFDFDLYVKSLGRPIGGAVDPASVDGDGDGMRTGRDGKDNVPAPKIIESLVQRDGSVLKFFRTPNPNSEFSDRIHVLDDKGNVVKEMWALKDAPEWNERKPIKSADSILNNLDNLEKDLSKKYGDIRDPENMSKAVRSVFPNLYKDLDVASLYPLRNEDGSVRDVDVARVAMLLKGGLEDPETAGRIDVISVKGNMAGGLFGGNMPGVFVYGASDNPDKTFFAGLDFSPDKEPTFMKTHGWGLKVLTEMRDSGYSKKDIDSFYGAYLASHEFGHAKHLLRALEKDGINVEAKSDEDLIGNIRAFVTKREFQRMETDEEIELAIRSELLIRGHYERYKDKSDAEKRHLALMIIMEEAEGFYFVNFKEKDALWDDLSDDERTDISQREEWQKVSGYAAENALEFVAETISQGLMGYEEGHTPMHWSKMADWLKVKSAKAKGDLVRRSVKDIYPDVTGKVTAICDGFIGAKPDKKEVLSKGVLPAAVKILGKPIGGASEVDGDGDLMTTGPDGKDNVPVVPVAAVARSGSGAKFLDAIDKQQAVLEKEFGDLSNRKNAKAAFEKTFSNLRNFDLFEEGDEPLSVLQVGQVVAFLSLGKDKRVADSLTAFEELTDLNGGGKGGFGQCQVGIDMDKHPTGLGHALLMRNAPHAGGHGIKGWTGIAWADDVVLKMRQEGASVDDIDRFFGFAVATHEWSHAEHNVASFEFLGINVEDDAPTYLRKIHIAMGGEGKKFDEDFGALVERQKEKGFSDEEAIIRALGALTGNDKNWKKVTNFMEKGLEDDLDASDLSNLGPAFSAMTSKYAAKNLQELVAEKNSAIKMGHPSGPSNPAWRKLAAFVSGGVKAEQEIANLTRQQRRALERQKKKSLKQDIEKNSVLIYHSCTGYGAQDDQKSESSKDALSGVVTASDDDLDWFPYSHPIEGFDGVLERSEKGEFFDWESAFLAEDLAFEVDGKSLKDWFTEDWVDISRPKPDGGFEPCGRSDASKGKYPKCVPASRAAKMSADEIASAVRRKRRAESVEVRKDKKPIYVSTDKKEESSFGIFEKSAIPVDAVLYARVKAEAKAKFDVYPSAYANAWLVREYKKRGGKYRTGEKGLAEDALEKGEVLRDPKGGLTAAGRRHFRETEGSNLLPGVRGAANTPTKMRRKGSFLTRFFTNPSGPMKDEKGKPTRLALSAAAWGEPVPQNMEDAAELAAKGRRLLERYANSKKKSADGDNL